MSYYSKKVPKGLSTDVKNLKGLSVNPFKGGNSVIVSGKDKVREDIYNLFAIRKGEYFFNPEIGSNLDEYLFEPNDFLLRDMLTKVVTTQIEKHLQHVKVTYVEVTQGLQSVEIYVSYKILSLGLSDTIVLYKHIQEIMDF